MRLLLSFLLFLVPTLGVWTFYTAKDNGWWMPPGVSTYAPDIDYLFYLILWMVAFFFILTEGLLVYFVFKYAREDDTKAVFSHGNHKLELIWTVIPGILLLVIAFSQMGTWAKIKYRGNLPQSEPIAHVWASHLIGRCSIPALMASLELGMTSRAHISSRSPLMKMSSSSFTQEMCCTASLSRSSG